MACVGGHCGVSCLVWDWRVECPFRGDERRSSPCPLSSLPDVPQCSECEG